MVARPDHPVEREEIDLADLSRGAPVRADAQDVLENLLGPPGHPGHPFGLEGLSKLFQPSFPGVRPFAIGVRSTPDRAVELNLVGIARDGEPVWTGTRAFLRGPTGALEIDVGFDEVDPRYQSRNITVDTARRQIALLRQLDPSPAARMTIDAEAIGRYACALHGFVFADETEEGPSPRSKHAVAPTGDRRRIIEAASEIVARFAQRMGLGKTALDLALEQLHKARTGLDLVRLRLTETPPPPAETDSDEELGVSAVGRAILLDEAVPAWRGALYVNSSTPLTEWADTYRRRKTARSRARLRAEIELARRGLSSGNRAERLRSLRMLGMLGTPELEDDLKRIGEGKERRTAALARRVLDHIQGVGLEDRVLAYASDRKNPARRRALAYRVLAEHFPKALAPLTSMLRVDPDARIQRAAVPLVASQAHNAAPALAALLAANPIVGPDKPRPGLEALRLDIIDWLTVFADPRTLLPLTLAYRAQPPPPPAEVLALSRALVAFNDPRAKMVLRAGSFPLTRPEVP